MIIFDCPNLFINLPTKHSHKCEEKNQNISKKETNLLDLITVEIILRRICGVNIVFSKLIVLNLICGSKLSVLKLTLKFSKKSKNKEEKILERKKSSQHLGDAY